MSRELSRRDLLTNLFAGFRRPAPVPTRQAQSGRPLARTPQARIAIVQGRFCLAYHAPCAVCVEQCPITGAIAVTKGIPRVNLDICTGCGVCQQVCPAPTNAILMLPRRQELRTTP